MRVGRGFLVAFSLGVAALASPDLSGICALQVGKGLEVRQMTPSLLGILHHLDLLETSRVRDQLERGDVSIRVDRYGGYTSLKCWRLDALFSSGTGELIGALPGTSDNPPIEPELTREQYVAKARQLLDSLPPFQHDSVDIIETVESDVMNLRFVFQVAGRDCSNTAHFQFYRNNGSLASFRIEERLDHSLYGRDPIRSRTEARSAALDAFQRFHPYLNASISLDGILEVGIRNLTPRLDMAHEVPSALAEAWAHHVSSPYYIFQFMPIGSSSGGWGDLQNVYVDARDLRPLTIEFGIVLSGQGQSHLPNMPSGVEVTVASTRGQAQRVSGGASGLPLLVEGLERVFRARFDADRGLVFLPWNNRWVAYRPDPALAKAMAAAVKRPLPAFGVDKQ